MAKENFITGSERVLIEQRIFNTGTFFLALVAAMALGLHIVFGSPALLVGGVAAAAVIFGIFFYMSRFRKNFTVSSTWFLFTAVLFTDYLWLITPNQSTSVTFLYLFTLIFALYIKPTKIHFRFTGILVLNLAVVVITLQALEVSSPLLEADYFAIPIYFYLAAFLVVFSLVGSYFKLSYEVDRAALHKTLRKQKNSNIALENRNQHLVSFGHMISHNLRSPMAGMKMLFSLYEMNDNQEEKEGLINHLKEGAAEMFNMVEDLSTVMKDYTKLNEQLEEIKMANVFQKTTQTLATQIRETEATIKTDWGVSAIHYVPVYIESILLNLISNAIKYRHHERKPEITVRTYLKEHAVMLTVEDNGLGLDMDKYGHQLFKMYKTFHPEAGENSKGIGLFLIKNQVELMGGKVEVESELNQGTTFLLELYRT